MRRKNEGGPERIPTISQEGRPDISWSIREWPDVCVMPYQSRWSRIDVVLSSGRAISSVVYLQLIRRLCIITCIHCNGTTVAKFSTNRVPSWNNRHYTSGEPLPSPCARRPSPPDCLWCCWPVVTPSWAPYSTNGFRITSRWCKAPRTPSSRNATTTTGISTADPTATAGTSTGSITGGARGTTGTRTGPMARFTGLPGTIPGDMTPGGMITGDTIPGDTDTAAFTQAFRSVRVGAGADIPIITAPTVTVDITRATRIPGIPITAGGGTIIRERFAREADNGARAAPQWGAVQEPAADMQATSGAAGFVR